MIAYFVYACFLFLGWVPDLGDYYDTLRFKNLQKWVMLGSLSTFMIWLGSFIYLFLYFIVVPQKGLDNLAHDSVANVFKLSWRIKNVCRKRVLFIFRFCILREENDLDFEMSRPLYTRVPGMEVQWLKEKIVLVG